MYELHESTTSVLALERPHGIVLRTALERMTAGAGGSPIRNGVPDTAVRIDFGPQPAVPGEPAVSAFVHNGVGHCRAAVGSDLLEDDRTVRERCPSGELPTLQNADRRGVQARANEWPMSTRSIESACRDLFGIRKENVCREWLRLRDKCEQISVAGNYPCHGR